MRKNHDEGPTTDWHSFHIVQREENMLQAMIAVFMLTSKHLLFRLGCGALLVGLLIFLHAGKANALCLWNCPSSELSGVYQRSWARQIYKVTFGPGHTINIISPSNGESFDGTYKIEGNTVQADFGWAKLNYQIIDSKTLHTNWRGTPVQLDKQ